jgi:hypothetical protein
MPDPRILIEEQHILHHVTVSFSLLEAVEIVPSDVSQLRLKGNLDRAEVLAGKQVRQHDHTIGIKCSEEPINTRLV